MTRGGDAVTEARTEVNPAARAGARETRPQLAEELLRKAKLVVGSGELLSFAIPAPVADPIALLAHAEECWGKHAARVLWEPPNGPRVSGVGSAARVVAVEGAGFGEVERWAEGLSARTHAAAFGGATTTRTKFFGGFAFDPGRPVDARWRGFENAAFVLPELLYEREGKTARLVAFFDGAADGADAPAFVGRVEHALAALEDAATSTRLSSLPPIGSDAAAAAAATVTHRDRGAWGALVVGARAAIRAGDLEKVVLAREAHVSFAAPPSRLALLTRLRAAYPECFTFAIAPGDAGSGDATFGGTAPGLFLGATPERLLQKRGAQVITEALAGSIGTTGARAAEALRQSHKDMDEHEVVVRHIASRLAPRARELSYPKEPGVRVLPNVIHLATPIHATLSAPVHILGLVRELHPTPAVGGAPAEDALAWIREHEGFHRGWYAGPVGWFDEAGDGEFGVALRSGLITDREAWLFGGAGIVRDSDPEAEYEETALKLRALLGALGT